MKLLLLAFVLCLGHSLAYAQVNENRYSKIILEEKLSTDQALQIQNYVKALPGMVTGRMDNTTNVLLAIYKDENANTDEIIMQWLAASGYNVACFFSDKYEEGKMVEISLNNCH